MKKAFGILVKLGIIAGSWAYAVMFGWAGLWNVQSGPFGGQLSITQQDLGALMIGLSLALIITSMFIFKSAHQGTFLAIASLMVAIYGAYLFLEGFGTWVDEMMVLYALGMVSAYGLDRFLSGQRLFRSASS